MDRNDYYGGDSTSLNLNQVTIINASLSRLLTIFWNAPHFSEVVGDGDP
jgi:RAB protein geranylgeranyltransferase component A